MYQSVHLRLVACNRDLTLWDLRCHCLILLFGYMCGSGVDQIPLQQSSEVSVGERGLYAS